MNRFPSSPFASPVTQYAAIRVQVNTPTHFYLMYVLDLLGGLNLSIYVSSKANSRISVEIGGFSALLRITEFYAIARAQNELKREI